MATAQCYTIKLILDLIAVDDVKFLGQPRSATFWLIIFFSLILLLKLKIELVLGFTNPEMFHKSRVSHSNGEKQRRSSQDTMGHNVPYIVMNYLPSSFQIYICLYTAYI